MSMTNWGLSSLLQSIQHTSSEAALNDRELKVAPKCSLLLKSAYLHNYLPSVSGLDCASTALARNLRKWKDNDIAHKQSLCLSSPVRFV